MTDTTIGVAISVPPPFGATLDAVRASSGDPLAEFIPAHVTLLGPTPIDASRITAVEAHLATVAAAHPGFRIRLRGTGTFRPLTQVVFVALSAGVGRCKRLAADVRSGPLARDLHFPYHPHVTIAHDVPAEALDRVHAELATFRADFPVDHFTLFVHADDGHLPAGRWLPIRDFKLA